MAKGQVRDSRIFFCNPGLIWRPTRRKPSKSGEPSSKPPPFLANFPKNFQKEAFVLVAVPKLISHFGGISRKKRRKKQQRCAGVKILGEKKIQHEDTGMVKVI
jgi:hypothetical protein